MHKNRDELNPWSSYLAS